MADTYTSNYNWTLPEVGASSTTWGTKLNANLTDIDLKVKANATAVAAAASAATAAQTTANNALPKGGGSLTGNISITTTYAAVALNASASGAAQFVGLKGGLNRWSVTAGNPTSESTGNVGSDFAIDRYNDAGTYIDSPIGIERATGIVTAYSGLYLNGTAQLQWSDVRIGRSSPGNLLVQDGVGNARDLSVRTLSSTDIAATGNITTAGSFLDGKGSVRSIPQNAQTGAYVLVSSDAGKHISITTGGVTVNAGVLTVGNAVTIFNNSGSSQTITQGASVTLRQAGTASTGNRTLAQYGVATLLCVGTDIFVISGAGLS